MEYKITGIHINDETLFELTEIDTGRKLRVDILVSGEIKPPTEAKEDWRGWKNSLIGKTIYIESLVPYEYFGHGESYFIN